MLTRDAQLHLGHTVGGCGSRRFECSHHDLETQPAVQWMSRVVDLHVADTNVLSIIWPIFLCDVIKTQTLQFAKALGARLTALKLLLRNPKQKRFKVYTSLLLCVLAFIVVFCKSQKIHCNSTVGFSRNVTRHRAESLLRRQLNKLQLDVKLNLNVSTQRKTYCVALTLR